MAKKINITTAIPDSLLNSEMSCTAKVLCAVLIQNARKKENKITLSNEEMAESAGISLRSVTYGLNELKEANLIKESVVKGTKKRELSVDKSILAAVNGVFEK